MAGTDRQHSARSLEPHALLVELLAEFANDTRKALGQRDPGVPAKGG